MLKRLASKKGNNLGQTRYAQKLKLICHILPRISHILLLHAVTALQCIFEAITLVQQTMINVFRNSLQYKHACGNGPFKCFKIKVILMTSIGIGRGKGLKRLETFWGSASLAVYAESYGRIILYQAKKKDNEKVWLKIKRRMNEWILKQGKNTRLVKKRSGLLWSHIRIVFLFFIQWQWNKCKSGSFEQNNRRRWWRLIIRQKMQLKTWSSFFPFYSFVL